MIDYLINYIKDHFKKDKNSQIDFILLSGGKGKKGCLIFTFYLRGKPIVIAKVSREEESYLKNEYGSLKTLQRILQGSSLKKTIETPLAFLDYGGKWVLFKEYKKGVTGDAYLTRRNLRHFLHLVTDWLIKFFKETKDYHIRAPREKEEVAKKLIGGNLPEYFKYWIKKNIFFVGPTHSDLILSNILINDSKISGVIDFKKFSLKGLPEADLIGIIVSSATTLFGYTEEAISKAFFIENYFSQEVLNVFKKYCDAFKIPIEDFLKIMPIYSERAILIAKEWGQEISFLSIKSLSKD